MPSEEVVRALAVELYFPTSAATAHDATYDHHEIKNSRFFGVPSTNSNYFANYSANSIVVS